MAMVASIMIGTALYCDRKDAHLYASCHQQCLPHVGTYIFEEGKCLCDLTKEFK